MTTPRPQRRLSKREVEMLLGTYDLDPVAALEVALRRLCELTDADFDTLVQHLAAQGRLSPTRRHALVQRQVDALDSLATELNETRALPS